MTDGRKVRVVHYISRESVSVPSDANSVLVKASVCVCVGTVSAVSAGGEGNAKGRRNQGTCTAQH